MTVTQTHHRGRSWLVPGVCGILAVLLAVPALLGLRATSAATDHLQVDGVPVTVMRPATDGRHPVVVISHGFAGSGVIMSALAEQVVQAGAIAVTFDFVGHGANPVAMPSGGGMSAAGQAALQEDLQKVLTWVAAQPDVNSQEIALVGHSMGAGAVVRYAVDHPTSLRSTVAISLPSAADIPAHEPGVPRNLLLLVGSAEPASFGAAALAGLQAGYPSGALENVYGSASSGTLRSAQVIAGSEHVGIVFAPATATAVTQWLVDTLAVDHSASTSPALQLPPAGMHTLLWLALLLAAGLLVMVPITRLLYPQAAEPPGQSARRWSWAVLAVAIAVLAADIIARLLQNFTSLLPLAVGGYLVSWFTSAGVVLMALAQLLPGLGRARPELRQPNIPNITWLDLLRAVVGATVVVLLIALPSKLTWAPFALVGDRWWLSAVMLVGFITFFWGEETLLRQLTTARRWLVVVIDRVLVIAALLAAIPLLGAPGFLILLLPLMVLLLFLLAGFAGIVARRKGAFLAVVLVQAVPLALLAATTFPLLMSS